MTKEELIEKLNALADDANKRFNGDFIYTAKENDWQGYGKSRTYFSIIETRTGSKHYKEIKFGYYDNQKNEYCPTDRYYKYVKDITKTERV